MRKFLSSLIIIIASLISVSSDIGAAPPVNPPEDFVKASVVVAGPGKSIYSCTGHAFFRMQCPSANMDFCFSYESEDIANRVLTFLGGNLKMGMAAAPTNDFFEQYISEGRSITEYPLALPIRVKQNLWKVLDTHVDEGMELPYDYLERGCAISVLHLLEEALGSERLEIHGLSSRFDKSRREILSAELENDPWSRLAINVLTNGSANMDVENKEKAITPDALIELLSHSYVMGKRIISSENSTTHASQSPVTQCWVSPILISIIVLILTIIFGLKGNGIMLKLLVGVQCVIGLLNVYLIFFSSLCATEWSWLLIPFNPLPGLLWKWRKKWELFYSAIIYIWTVIMAVIPHSLTDPALMILALSTGIAFSFDKLLPSGIPESYREFHHLGIPSLRRS